MNSEWNEVGVYRGVNESRIGHITNRPKRESVTSRKNRETLVVYSVGRLVIFDSGHLQHRSCTRSQIIQQDEGSEDLSWVLRGAYSNSLAEIASYSSENILIIRRQLVKIKKVTYHTNNPMTMVAKRLVIAENITVPAWTKLSP